MFQGKFNACSSTRQGFRNSSPDWERRTVIFLALAITFFACAVPVANAQSDVELKLFNIPQQRADLSLTQFAEQADLTLIFKFNKAREKTANKLEGTYSVSDGIKILLKDTGLQPVFSDQGLLMSVTDETSGPEGDEMIGKKTGLLAALTTIFGATPSMAQDNDAVVEEVVVVGVRGSYARSLDQKRASDGIVDGISAEDINDFPDLNVSESLARIPGVTIDRTLGEGNRVTVRGLNPEFTRITINGQTVTSGNAGREVDFDVFASELFSGIELAKTPSASLTEGGLAATINLRTARPFDYSNEGPIFSLSVQGAQNDLRDEWDPRISALASNTFANGTVGLLASVSYSETSLRQDNAEGLRFRLTDVDVDADGTPELTGVEYPFIPRYLLELFDRERLGVTAALQYQPNGDFDLSLDLAYADFDTVRKRYSIDGLISGNDFTGGIAAGLPTVDSTGLITQVTLDDVVSRSENILSPEEEDLFLVNLDGAFRFADNWEARGKVGFSESSRERPEVRSVWQTSGEFSYDLSDRIFYDINQTNADFNNPADFIANQHRFETFEIEDEEVSLQVDLERFLDSGRFFSSIEGGIRYNDREKSQVEFDSRVTVTGDAIAPGANQIASFPVSDFFTSSGAPQIERSWFVPIFSEVLSDTALVPAGFEPSQVFTNSFVIEEETVSGYIQANIDGELGSVPVRGNLGVRVVNTDQTSNGFATINGAPAPIVAENDYSEPLPSLNFVLEPTDDFLIRFAASKSLTRPTLTRLSPGGSIQPTGLTASVGNPTLDPFTAEQFDISFEWYFAEEALASLTYFNKDVDGFITNVTFNGMLNEIFSGITGPILNDSGEDVINEIFALSVPINGDKATVEGFEASFQMPFTSLPAPFDGLGMAANYTYADSKSTITFNGAEVTTLLPGQSESSYNIVGYFETDRFSTRLAYSWRDDYLREVRPRDTERSNFIGDYGQLDMNIQYDATDNIVLTFDALNLLDEEEQEYGETTDRNRRFSNWGRFFIFGARVKFD